MPDISKVIDLGPSGVSKPDKASVFMELKGKEICASPHIGVKAEPENVTLIGYTDEESADDGVVNQGWRSFDVLPGSEKVLLASGRDID